MNIPDRLGKFLAAQDAPAHRSSHASTYEVALEEISTGAKTSHWIWFVFPQLLMGNSPNSVLYAMDDSTHAREYLAHGILGGRLREITRAALLQLGPPGNVEPRRLMGSKIDCQKLASSMTLFSLVAADVADADFARDCEEVLDHLERHGFGRCETTLARLGIV